MVSDMSLLEYLGGLRTYCCWQEEGIIDLGARGSAPDVQPCREREDYDDGENDADS